MCVCVCVGGRGVGSYTAMQNSCQFLCRLQGGWVGEGGGGGGAGHVTDPFFFVLFFLDHTSLTIISGTRDCEPQARFACACLGRAGILYD